MKIGVPTEIKNREYRVGLTPESVAAVVSDGHAVVAQAGAGAGIGAADAAYRAAGAAIAKTAKEVFARADMIVKVKEPLAQERKMLRRGQTLFTYLHLAADKTLTQELLASGANCIAYETITGAGGGLPLLAPMSQVAGRLAAQAAAHYLQKSVGGCGRLMGGVPGVPPAKVVVLGGGIVGRNAARIAAGMGADVTVLEKSAAAMDALTVEFNGRVRALFSSSANIAAAVAAADVVVGGVLIPGAAAPKLITEKMVKSMKPGAVVVDVAIDQGGCIATAKPTTHDNPVYVRHGVVHYCVANMPGAVPHTSTYALNNVTLPFALKIAKHGWRKAAQQDSHLANGVSVVGGALTCAQTAASLKMRHTPLAKAAAAQ